MEFPFINEFEVEGFLYTAKHTIPSFKTAVQSIFRCMLKMLLFPRHLITTSLSVAFYLTIFVWNEVENSVSGNSVQRR